MENCTRYYCYNCQKDFFASPDKEKGTDDKVICEYCKTSDMVEQMHYEEDAKF